MYNNLIISQIPHAKREDKPVIILYNSKRRVREMEWIEGMNKSVDYIEEHLAEEIKPEALSSIAACSVFHYQRMFAFITGFTLSEYIRRRRMSAAAFELSSGAKVLDTALKYGYDSPTSFTRAFRAIHGISPSEAKKDGVSLSSFPKIIFTFSIKGEKAMNYKIIKKESFRIVGYKTEEPMTMDNCFEICPKFWEEVAAKGGFEKLYGIMSGKEPAGILGVSTCENGDYGAYFICAASDVPVPEGMSEYLVPETTYAVFEAIGPADTAVQEVQQRIISEWLPSSGYEYAPAPDIEVYPAGNRQAADYKTEIWLPIIKKS